MAMKPYWILVCFLVPLAQATTINFDSPTGPLGTSSHTYGTGDTVIATGYNSSNSLTNLYGKNDGGDENGLGLTNDSSGDHEITAGSMIQLNLSSLIADGVTSVTIVMGSTTNGETWEICKDTTAGSLVTCSNTGKSEGGAGIVVTSISTFLDITTIGKDNSGANSNVLLTSLTYDSGGGSTQSTPEPVASLLMASGLGILGLLKRRGSRSKKDSGILLIALLFPDPGTGYCSLYLLSPLAILARAKVIGTSCLRNSTFDVSSNFGDHFQRRQRQFEEGIFAAVGLPKNRSRKPSGCCILLDAGKPTGIPASMLEDICKNCSG